ncbi:MAG: AmmeMemoRadiSam system protein B [Chloroflexi bacterium]|nr:AmmeMemoRadiSam system protein B [Chloroflexota bacterium]
MDPLDLRPSPISGAWYESHPQALAAGIDSYLDQAELPELHGRVVAVIAPHAGHYYSGAVAGYAFAAVRGASPEVVAVISPMHHPYPAALLTARHDAYATPLGGVRIDKTLLAALDGHLKPALGFGVTPVPNDPEHSLEIELPFLQRALAGHFTLLPVMVRAQEPEISQALGEALAACLRDKQALLVASTDLSHFFDQETACLLDAEMLRRIESFAPESLFVAERTGRGFACGHAAVAAVLWAARSLGADTVKVLRHATSGDVSGDYRRVVGYGAAAVLKSGTG